MYFLSKYLGIGLVALLAEGVDRNNTGDLIPVYLDEGRPPRGGRG